MNVDNHYHSSFPHHSAPLVKYPFGVQKKVRNFGWLFRQAASVEYIKVEPQHWPEYAAQVTATMRGGTVMQTEFADYRELWPLLHRPVFQHVTLQWGSTTYPINPLQRGEKWENRAVPILDTSLTARTAVGG